MKVAVICEYSGTVRDSFIKQGHEAISFDILPTDSHGPHIQFDVTKLPLEFWKQFDLAICHPPCTYLTYAANRSWNTPGRAELREEGMKFFKWCCELPIKKICVENPMGYPNTVYRKPDQIIHPYYFGEPFQKKTCLWLKELPILDYSKTIIEKPAPLYICQGEKSKGKAIGWCEGSRGNNGVPRWKVRSKTFQGIANAMSQQWGTLQI